MVTKIKKSPDFPYMYVSLWICIQIYPIDHLERKKNSANFLVFADSFHRCKKNEIEPFFSCQFKSQDKFSL